MKTAPILSFLAVFGGGLVGWLSTPQIAAPSTGVAPIIPRLVHAGADAAIAREKFVGLGFGAEPVFTADVAPEPAPPDVAVLFRRDLTAIETGSAGTVVWIVDFTQSFGRRALKVGDVYQDGWRVTAIGPQSVELRRRRESRRIQVFELPVEGSL